MSEYFNMEEEKFYLCCLLEATMAKNMLITLAIQIGLLRLPDTWMLPHKHYEGMLC